MQELVGNSEKAVIETLEPATGLFIRDLTAVHIQEVAGSSERVVGYFAFPRWSTRRRLARGLLNVLPLV